MNRLASLAIAALPVLAVVACTQETSVKDNPAPAATDTSETDPGDASADAAEDAGDPCACPNQCESTAEEGWMVCTPPEEAPNPKKVPLQQTIGDYNIGNFEYWPYKSPSPYPDDTICGFNGEQACGWNGPAKGPPPVAAQKCMFQAREVLVDILTNDVPPELDALRDKHGVFRFWNWNNDMTDAPATRVPSSRALWLYDGTRGDGGLIKWISETERDGKCHLPTREDLVKFAKACVDDFPNCSLE